MAASCAPGTRVCYARLSCWVFDVKQVELSVIVHVTKQSLWLPVELLSSTLLSTAALLGLVWPVFTLLHIRYDTMSYLNLCSKAGIGQASLPHGNQKYKKWQNEKQKIKMYILRSSGKQSVKSVLQKTEGSGGKDLWAVKVLSLEWKSKEVMDGQSVSNWWYQGL